MPINYMIIDNEAAIHIRMSFLLDKTHTYGLRNEFANQLLEVTAASFPHHDIRHFLADLADLTALSIACTLHLLTSHNPFISTSHLLQTS